MSVLLGLVGLAVFCVSVFAVLRGHLKWARLPNRRRASGAALVGLALFLPRSASSAGLVGVLKQQMPCQVGRIGVAKT